MSLEAILSKIEKDAAAEAASIVKAAEDEKKKALDENASRLKAEFEREQKKVDSRISDSLRRREYHVRREASRRLMNARRELIDNALSKAMEDLASSDGYLQLITSLIEECDLTGTVEVVIRSGDESRITAEFLKKHSGGDRTFVLSEERHDAAGGVIFRSGSVSQNGTFSMIAELAHDDLVMQLSELVPLEEIQGDV